MIIDFIDERFDLFKFSDGAICTISPELIRSGFNKETEKGKVIKSGSEEHFKLWNKGWKEFISSYENVKFAFYLYKDNDKVDIKWYSEENFYELVNPQGGEYRVTYFIKNREEIISARSFDIIKI